MRDRHVLDLTYKRPHHASDQFLRVASPVKVYRPDADGVEQHVETRDVLGEASAVILEQRRCPRTGVRRYATKQAALMAGPHVWRCRACGGGFHVGTQHGEPFPKTA